MGKKTSAAAAEIAKHEVAEAKKSAGNSAGAERAENVSAGSPAPVVEDTDLWSSSRIAALADGITQKLGAEQNLMARTLFVALDGSRFLPVRVYPYLIVARRAVVGMGLMMVASLSPIDGPAKIDYKFEIGTPEGGSKLVEVWTVRVGDNIVARFLLAPSETIAADLVREDVAVAAYTIKPKE